MEDLREQVRRAARGDEAAAGAVFDHYYPRVFRYAVGRVGNEKDAEDIASETFARVLRNLDRFRWRGGGFEAWLFRIAGNLVMDHHRRGGREDPHEDVEPTGEAASPEHAVLGAEQAGELRRLVAGLPDEQKEVVLMRFAAGLDTNEVAKATGRNANAVRQLQFRALRNLRRQLEAG